MAIRNILHDDDPSLRKSSRIITDFNQRLHTLIDDMRETLFEANGLGLAAVQVGVLRRVVLIVDTSLDSDSEDDQIVELINPEIIETSGEQTSHEGCLSFPSIYGIVTRPNFVKIKAFDRNGNAFTYTGEELVARAICHEIDHINGKVFIDIVERFLTEEEIEALRSEAEQDAKTKKSELDTQRQDAEAESE